MSNRTFKITINNPCSNDWNDMDPVSVGRFCHSCQKNVVDFSGKNDSEIKDYIQKHQNEELCGRFLKSQVDTIRIEFDQNIFHSNIKSWQKFLVVLMLCFGSDVLGIDFCLAQTHVQDSTWVQDSTSLQAQTDTLQIQTPDSLTQALEVDTTVKKFVIDAKPFQWDNQVIFLDRYISGGIGYQPIHILPEGFDWQGSPVFAHVLTTPEATAESSEKPETKKTSVTDYGSVLNPALKNPGKRPQPNPGDQQNQNLYVLIDDERLRKGRKRRKA